MFPQQVFETEWITMHGQILGEQDLQHGVQCYHHIKAAAAGHRLGLDKFDKCTVPLFKDWAERLKKKERKKPKCLRIFKNSRGSNHTPSKINCLDLCFCFFFFKQIEKVQLFKLGKKINFLIFIFCLILEVLRLSFAFCEKFKFQFASLLLPLLPLFAL